MELTGSVVELSTSSVNTVSPETELVSNGDKGSLLVITSSYVVDKNSSLEIDSNVSKSKSLLGIEILFELDSVMCSSVEMIDSTIKLDPLSVSLLFSIADVSSVRVEMSIVEIGGVVAVESFVVKLNSSVKDVWT